MPILWVDLPDMLIAKGIVQNMTAARTAATYALMWMQGSPIDFSKSAPNVHRARLRKLGLDIKRPYDFQFYNDDQARSIVAERNSGMAR